MKRLLLILTVFAAIAGTAAAEDTYSRPGSVTAQLGAGLGWGGLIGSVVGGVDIGLVQLPLGSEFPLDVGIAGRAGLSIEPAAGLGAYGTLHYSWKALHSSLEWLDHMETYLGVGLEVLPRIGLDGYLGSSYHFNNHWNVFVEGSLSVLSVGAGYRF